MIVVAFEWTWDNENKSAAAEVSPCEQEVRFHINYSSGTAAVRGTRVMTDRQYFWEVKMTTPVYGTDMVPCFCVDFWLMDQELVPYHYLFCCCCCCCLGDAVQKCLRLRRFNSDRDEICQDCSSSKYTSIGRVRFSI